MRHLPLRIALHSMWGTTGRWCGCPLGLDSAGRRYSALRWSSRYVRFNVSPIISMYLVCSSRVGEAVGVRFVRVFYEGAVLSGLEWVQLDEFVGRLRALVPDRLFQECMGH